MSNLEKYRKLEKLMLAFVRAGDEEGKEECLDRLDELWASLTLAERAKLEDRDL